MPAWKVFVVAVFAVVCFSLVLGTLAAVITMEVADGKWWWFSGGFLASLVMVSLFVLFLNHADKSFGR